MSESEHKAKEFKSMDERDVYVEASYRFDRLGYDSIPAYVAGERDSLVREFMIDWLPEQRWEEGSALQSLICFEAERFGAALEPVAHWLLWFEVKKALKVGVPAESKVIVPPMKENEPPSAYMRRIAIANRWMSPGDPEPGRTMPEVRESEQEVIG